MVVLDSKIVPADERHELPQLVGLGLPAAVLEVELLRQTWPAVHVVAPLYAKLVEPERFQQPLGICKCDVGEGATEQAVEKGVGLHQVDATPHP